MTWLHALQIFAFENDNICGYLQFLWQLLPVAFHSKVNGKFNFLRKFPWKCSRKKLANIIRNVTFCTIKMPFFFMLNLWQGEKTSSFLSHKSSNENMPLPSTTTVWGGKLARKRVFWCCDTNYFIYSKGYRRSWDVLTFSSWKVPRTSQEPDN